MSKGGFLTDDNFTTFDSSEIKDILTLFLDARNSNSKVEYKQKQMIAFKLNKRPVCQAYSEKETSTFSYLLHEKLGSY